MVAGFEFHLHFTFVSLSVFSMYILPKSKCLIPDFSNFRKKLNRKTHGFYYSYLFYVSLRRVVLWSLEVPEVHGPRFAAHGTVSLNPETFGAIGLEGRAEREWWTCGLRAALQRC